MATLIPYPHLSSTSAPPLPAEVLATYTSIFNARVATGHIRPFVLPYHLYGLFPVAAYLCIPQSRKSPWLKWAVLVLVWYWQIKNIRETGSRSVANGLAAGLISAWGMVWTATWIWFKADEVEGMKRVRRRVKGKRGEGMLEGGEKSISNGNVNGNMERNGSQHASVRRREIEDTKEAVTKQDSNGYTKEPNSTDNKVDETKRAVQNGHSKTPEFKEDEEYEYYWESYPQKLSERIPWVQDLIMNFRGPGWSWAIPPLPPLSTTFKTTDGKPLYSTSFEPRYKRKTFHTRAEMTRYRLPIFLTSYIALDIIKTTMMYDPYFLFGPTTYALPAYISHLSPFFLDYYRKALGTAGVLISLELIFSLPPLITLLLPSSSQAHLLLTPPYYPSTWGPITSFIETGLPGLWGNWWHQTFRYGFSAPYEWALSTGYIKPNTLSSRLLALLCAFSISGFLHAAGSYTETAHTIPMNGFFFFILQGLGVLIQSSFCKTFKKQLRGPGWVGKPWVRKTGNVLFVMIWLWGTGNWLLDEFARTGVWMYEPVPLSFARGLGWGVEDFAVKGRKWSLGWDWARFWIGGRWEPVGVKWYNGNRWWESGLAI